MKDILFVRPADDGAAIKWRFGGRQCAKEQDVSRRMTCRGAGYANERRQSAGGRVSAFVLVWAWYRKKNLLQTVSRWWI
jgi:hypothetical protein